MAASTENERVAMIDAGKMANTVHYPLLASFDDIEIAAICDVNTERLDDAANRYGVERRYSQYRQMVEQVTPDAVYAIGPPHTMYDIWAWCLKRGPIVHAVCRFYKCAIEPFLSARDHMMGDSVRADDAVRWIGSTTA